MTEAPPPNRRSARVGGLLVSLVTLALMLWTEPGLAIVWDEGYTLGRQERLRLWFGALRDPSGFARRWTPPERELVQQVGAPPPRPDQIDTRAKLLSDPQVLAWFWPFAREEPHGHPPLYALVGLLGDMLTPNRPLLSRARLGPILIFSLTAGILFGFVAGRWGAWAGTVAALAWVLQPNLFAHGHYATYDALLSALWLLSVLAFSIAVERADPRAIRDRPRAGLRGLAWTVVFGLSLGFAFDTKLTGWFLPLPCLAWAGWTRDRRALVVTLQGTAMALLVVWILNPPWWTDPISGLTRFFASNLDRARTIPIKTLFLGEVLSTPDGSLPWYNTVVWTVLVTPVGLLLLACLGIVRAFRRRRIEPFGLLVVGHWTFVMILRALPNTPGHDGVRQFLPAFGLLAVLAGLGAATLAERLGRVGRLLVATTLMELVVGLALHWPTPLSYFSPVVGGLPGATALGMEPTYYWDSLDDETLRWLRENTSPGEKILFATFPTSWFHLADQGALPPGLRPNDPGVWSWYVLQNRPGSFSPLDRALVTSGKPVRVVSKFGVPLLWVFPFEQVEALSRPPRSPSFP